jgi:hypothetical protein
MAPPETTTAVGADCGVTEIVFVEFVEPQVKALEQEIEPELDPALIVCVAPPEPPVQPVGKLHVSVPLPVDAVY